MTLSVSGVPLVLVADAEVRSVVVVASAQA